jgi:hypothetical protein
LLAIRDRPAERLDAVGEPDGHGPRSKLALPIPSSRIDSWTMPSCGAMSTCSIAARAFLATFVTAGDEVVGGNLDALGQRQPGGQVQLDREWRASHERRQRWTEFGIEEDRRVDAGGDLAQIVKRPDEAGCDV